MNKRIIKKMSGDKIDRIILSHRTYRMMSLDDLGQCLIDPKRVYNNQMRYMKNIHRLCHFCFNNRRTKEDE